MASEIQAKYDAVASLTVTLSALANASGRQSTLLANSNKRPRVKCHAKILVGTTPTAGTTVDFYLIRGNGTINSDGAGASDAAVTVVNAQPVGSLVLDAATSDKAYYLDFMVEDIGPVWGLAVVNHSNAALKTDANNNNCITYEYMVPEAQ